MTITAKGMPINGKLLYAGLISSQKLKLFKFFFFCFGKRRHYDMIFKPSLYLRMCSCSNFKPFLSPGDC